MTQWATIILVEHDGHREVTSIDELHAHSHFWTINCKLVDSVESILREVPSEAALSDVIHVLHKNSFSIPEGPIFCRSDPSSQLDKYVFEGKEVELINIYRDQRRVDLKWVSKENQIHWRTFDEIISPAQSRLYIYGNSIERIFGLKEEIGVITSNGTFLCFDSPLATFLISVIEKAKKSLDSMTNVHLQRLINIIQQLLSANYDSDVIKRSLRDIGTPELLNIEELIDIFLNTNTDCFSMSIWNRTPAEF